MATGRVPAGDLLECRVARLKTRQGHFVRRRVDLNRFFEPEKLQVTDLDVLVYEFSPDLALRRFVGECKSGAGRSAPKTVDRVLWLAGLARLTGAAGAFLVSVSSSSRRLRGLGQELGVEVFDTKDVDRLESIVGIGSGTEWGAHDPSLLAVENDIRRTARMDQEIERAYWFLRSDFWHLEPVAGTKRVVAVIEALSRRWVEGLSPEEERAISWLMADALTAFSVACVRLSRRALLEPEDEFQARLNYDLSSGATSPAELERLSHSIDKFVMNILRKANVSPATATSALGAFRPRPPAYSDSLCEVLIRLASKPAASRQLPRLVEEVVTHRLRHGKTGLPDFEALGFAKADEVLAQTRLLNSFLTGNLAIDERATATFREKSAAVSEPQLPLEPVDEVVPHKRSDEA